MRLFDEQGRPKLAIDQKFIICIMVTIILSILTGLFLASHMKSASKLQCQDIGRVNIHRGDKDYYPSLDSDHDGIACEAK